MPSFTRRQMLLGGSAAGAVAVAGGFGAGAAAGWGWWGGDDESAGEAADNRIKAHSFFSRPDLKPPVTEVLKKTPGIDPGYVFVTPVPGQLVDELPDGVQAGPLMIDNDGEPVWFHPTSTMGLGKLTDLAADFRVQRYQGKPVLTYWRGELVVPPGFGRGEWVILDESYREIHTVRPAGDLAGDLHEFLITEDDTALLITEYNRVETDDGPVMEGVVQELDIASGEVKFEWHSLDHVSVEESLQARPDDPKTPYPYFHINSVEPDGDGLLISARHTSAVYRIDRTSGKVLWRLGGQRSDFQMLPGTYFKRQHDARRLPDGRISLFDNDVGTLPSQSRAIVLELDEEAGTARLVRSHKRPRGATASSQANAQFTESGHAFVGWGSAPFITEFTASSNVVFDAHLGGGGELDSYRAYRMPWVGKPDDKPAAAATGTEGGGMRVYASWNGATEVVGWRILTGSEPNNLTTATEVARAGFETEAKLAETATYAAVAALDSDGNVLGTSEAVQPAT